jgi:hypothetical protein
MRFTDLRDDVENISQVTDQRNLVNRIMNRTLSRIAGFGTFPFYLDEGFFTTVAEYTTGTASITNGSATVTGSGTSFTAAMVGRKIRFNGENAYYRILSFSSATSIALEVPYQGTTNTAATLSVYQDEFRLRGDVHVPHFMRQIEDGVSLFDVDPGEYDVLFPSSTVTGNPNLVVPIGTRRDTYSTGTVTASSKTITGTSTAWTSVQGLSRGSRIRIGNNVYTVQSVDSDTAITVYETVTTVTGVNAYVITLDNPRVLLHKIPDTAQNIYYRFYREPVPLINDYDEPDLPSDWQWLLVVGSLTELFTHKGDAERSLANEQQFITGLQRLKSQYRSVNRTYSRYPQGATTGRRLQPLFPTGTDIRAHAP